MMNRSLPLTAALFLALSPLAGHSQTLVQKQTIDSEDTHLSSAANNMNSFCHTSIASSIDWQSFVAADKVGDMNAVVYENRPSDLCSVPLAQLQALCQDLQGKQAISTRIKSYQCGYQAGAVPTLSLDPSGKLLFQSSFEAFHHMEHTDEAAFVRDWLGGHL